MKDEEIKSELEQVELDAAELPEENDHLVEVEPTEEQMSEVQDLLSGLPQEMLIEALSKSDGNGLKVTKIEQAVQQRYSGPLPPPKMLNDYELINSGFAERIVAMAEKEQSHRHGIEKTAVTGAIEKDKRSQNYALFAIVFLSLICGGLIYGGHDVAGTVLGGATLVGLVALFITGKRDNKSDSASSNTESEEP
ncbi:MAG: DUF2335 domain-containing protein [Psychrobium sp.]